MDSITGLRSLTASLGWRDLVEPSEEAAPVKRDESRPSGDAASGRAGAAGGSGLLTRLSGAAAALQEGAVFRQWSAVASPGVSGRALLSAQAGPGATAGAHRVEVIELARAERVFGSVEPDAEAPLGVAGEFHLNGHPVSIAACDSLADVRDRINTANRGPRPSGVTATVLTTGPGAHRLVLTADCPGTRGIELVDGAAARGALRWLGIADGTTMPNWSPAESGRTESQRLADPAAPLAALLDTAPPPPTTVRAAGGRVRVDLGTDSLLSLLDRLGPEAAATVVEEQVGGHTWYRLSVVGTVTPDPAAALPGEGAPSAAARAASARAVELLGLVRPVPMEAISGADAVARVDGVLIRRRTNTLADVLPGVALTLLASDAALCTAAARGTGLTVARHPRSVAPGTYAVELVARSEGGEADAARIDREPAQWDPAAGLVRGKPGTRFEGLELAYAGPAVPGPVGELVVSGDIAVSLVVQRDHAAAVDAVARLVRAYNEAIAVGRRWREGRAGAPPRSRRLARAIDHLGTLPLAADERFGLRWTRMGTLQMDAGRLRTALASDADAAQRYYGEVGARVLEAVRQAAAEVAQEVRSGPEAEHSSGQVDAPGGEPAARLQAAADQGWTAAYGEPASRTRARLDLRR